MSGLVVGFYLLIPLLLALLVWRLWRMTKTGTQKAALAMVSLVVFLGLVWVLGGGEKGRLDKQVKELCAKDGGIRVYEMVRLPPDKFNSWGRVNFYRPTQGENALGPEYEVKTTVDYLRKGNPSLRRYHVQIIRKRDGRLLGESIGYDRGGGDLPGPWQPSSYSCPLQHGEIVLDRIFILDQGVKQ